LNKSFLSLYAQKGGNTGENNLDNGVYYPNKTK